MNITDFYDELYQAVTVFTADTPRVFIRCERPSINYSPNGLRASINVRRIYSQIAPSTTFVMVQQDNMHRSLVYLPNDRELLPSGEDNSFDEWAIVAFLAIAVQPMLQ